MPENKKRSQQKTEKISYLFVVNPISGGRDKTIFYEFLDGNLKEKDISYSVFETSENSTHREINEAIHNLKPECIVAVGGDGTLTWVVNAIREQDILIGFIPYGSMNGMARELDIPVVEGLTESGEQGRLNQIWELIQAKRIRHVDLVQINESYSMHFSDVGLNARIVKEYGEEKQHGSLKYVKQFARQYPPRKTFNYTITCEDETFTGKAYMIAFANARRMGSGMLINPNGKIDDGYFEICIIKDLDFLDLLNATISIFAEDYSYDTEKLEIISCRKAQVDLDRKETFQMDGEVMNETDHIQLSCKYHAVRIIAG